MDPTAGASPSPSCSRPPGPIWWWKRNQPIPSRGKNCFSTKNRPPKPVSFLRLSSTGESVEDSPVFEDFNPSNIQGSTGNSKPKSAGVLDRFAKPFCSSNISRALGQLATKNLTSATPAVFADRICSQMDLSLLVEKFDNSCLQVDPKMQGASYKYNGNLPHAAGVPSRNQGGLNGFVKEGVYHSYTRNSGSRTFASSMSSRPNVPVNGQPEVQGFRFLNIGTFHRNRYSHHHPYVGINGNGRERAAMSCMQFHYGCQPGTSRGPMHAVNTWAHTHTGISQGLHSRFVDPRIRSQFLSTETIADRLQGHLPKSRKGSRVSDQSKNRRSSSKNQTDVTQVSAELSHIHVASLNQGQSVPLKSKNITKGNVCRRQKSGRDDTDPSVPVCTNQTEKALQRGDCDCEVREIQSKNMPKSVSEEMKTSTEVDENLKIDDEGVVDSTADGRNPDETGGMGILPPTGMKCGDKETLANTVLLSCDLASQVSTNKINAVVQSTPRKKTDSFERENVTSSAELSDLRPVLNCSLNALHRSSEVDDALADESESCQDDSKSSKCKIRSPPAKLHSSLAYILSQTSDSDFTDSDWESSPSTSPPSDSWDFLKCWDDPYNPLYGWKCANRLTQAQDEQISQTVEFDCALDDERDSGISSLPAQQDASEDHSDSSSWDEDSYEETLNSSQLWEALCSSNDSLNPLNGWMCKSPQNLETFQLQIEPQTPRKNTQIGKGCEIKVQLKIENKPDDLSSVTNADEANCARSLKPSNSETILAPRKTKCDASKMHPSVLFILGMTDSDSESDSDWDWDSEESDDFDSFPDSEWNSDPYNPLLMWKRHPITPDKLKAVNSAYKCGAIGNKKVEHFSGTCRSTLPEQSTSLVAGTTVSKPLLKRTSSTSCLLVPDEGSGPGTGRSVQNKKVRFCERSPTVISFEVPIWSNEYMECRKGPWQEMARDRCRFMDRIRSTEAHIGHVFTPSHRDKVRERLDIQTV